MSSIVRWFVIGVIGFVVVSSISMASPYYCARPTVWEHACATCDYVGGIQVPLYDENGNLVVVGMHAWKHAYRPKEIHQIIVPVVLRGCVKSTRMHVTRSLMSFMIRAASTNSRC